MNMDRVGSNRERVDLSRRNVLLASIALTLPGSGRSSSLGRKLAAGSPEERLAARGIELPRPSTALGSYVPYVIYGNTAYISGHLPLLNGGLLHTGSVPEDVSVADAKAAARQCAINVLAVLKAACDGDLSRAEKCLKLTGYVATSRGFTDHSSIINGASDLIVDALGPGGRHAMASVGAASLPLNAPVEVEAVFQLTAA